MNYVGCSRCGKQVSNNVGVDVVVRAFVECPECIERASEPVELAATDSQQLKAEIAALVNEHFFTNENGTSCSGKYGVIAEKLRQLSAV